MEIRKEINEFYQLILEIKKISKSLLKYKGNIVYKQSFNDKVKVLEKRYFFLRKRLAALDNQRLNSLLGNIKGDIDTITGYKNPESTLEVIEHIEDKIWNKIEIELEDLEENAQTSVKIIHITGQRGWTDRNKKFSEFLKNLRGDILILDGYYGLGSFHVLDNFEDTKVQFLTAQMGKDENSEKIAKELQRFKKEFPKIELKKYAKFWEIHDRYILSDDMLVWVGHGIKDFGDKECFLIGIPTREVPEIVKNLRSEFDERWSKSDSLV